MHGVFINRDLTLNSQCGEGEVGTKYYLQPRNYLQLIASERGASVSFNGVTQDVLTTPQGRLHAQELLYNIKQTPVVFLLFFLFFLKNASCLFCFGSVFFGFDFLFFMRQKLYEMGW